MLGLSEDWGVSGLVWKGTLHCEWWWVCSTCCRYMSGHVHRQDEVGAVMVTCRGDDRDGERLEDHDRSCQRRLMAEHGSRNRNGA